MVQVVCQKCWLDTNSTYHRRLFRSSFNRNICLNINQIPLDSFHRSLTPLLHLLRSTKSIQKSSENPTYLVCSWRHCQTTCSQGIRWHDCYHTAYASDFLRQAKTLSRQNTNIRQSRRLTKAFPSSGNQHPSKACCKSSASDRVLPSAQTTSTQAKNDSKRQVFKSRSELSDP